jgi:hypothetical protein
VVGREGLEPAVADRVDDDVEAVAVGPRRVAELDLVLDPTIVLVGPAGDRGQVAAEHRLITGDVGAVVVGLDDPDVLGLLQVLVHDQRRADRLDGRRGGDVAVGVDALEGEIGVVEERPELDAQLDVARRRADRVLEDRVAGAAAEHVHAVVPHAEAIGAAG